MALKPVEDWAKGKQEYFAVTGEKKPREPVLKFFSTSHTGLSKSIAKCTEEWEARAPKERTAKNFEKIKREYESAAGEYIRLLEGLIDKESRNTQVWSSVKDGKIVSEKWKTESYRGLKMLKAKLENYKVLFERKYQDLAATERTQSESDQKESFAEKSMIKFREMEKTFNLGLSVGFKRLNAAAQAIKATPTVEVWNREFGQKGEAARSLTTALGLYKNLDKTARQLNIELTPKQQQLLQQTQQFVTQLSPWADGAKRSLPDGTDKDQILAELKQVTTIGKACAAHFGVAY